MDVKELTLMFLKRLQGDNGVTEISDLVHNLGGIEDYENIIEAFPMLDLYFISFVPNEGWKKAKEKSKKPPRTKNEFVGEINYFRADFDIRSYMYEHWGKLISDEELSVYKDTLLNTLKEDELLGSYNAVVLSGNGVHVYWIGKSMKVDPKVYAAQSTELYDRIKALFPLNPELWPDYSCGNVGRLLRLPGSTNHKKKFGLPAHKVQLFEYKEGDSPLVEYLEEVGLNRLCYEVTEVATLGNDMTRKCSIRAKLTGNEDEFWRINTKIDIAELVCRYTGRKVAKDGVNFVSKNDGKNTGAYIIPEENVVVHTGTPHFSDYFKVYSPYAFILVHYADFDARKAFKIAEEICPAVKQKGKYYFTKNEAKDDRKGKYVG